MRKPRDFDSELKGLPTRPRRSRNDAHASLANSSLRPALTRSTLNYWPGRCSMLSPPRTPRNGRAGARRALRSFAASNVSLRRDLNASRRALCRSKASRHRIEASKARTDTREWVMKRRERTRHLIELGGLVVKAGLVDLTDDDRAALYGAFLAVAGKLQGDERANALALWQRKGKRAFEAEQEARNN